MYYKQLIYCKLIVYAAYNHRYCESKFVNYKKNIKMLQKLYIKNYAIIDEAELQFSDKLTVITGETGAGKSILLGALSLILGQRADTNVLYNKAEKCVVEATFDIEGYNLQWFFEEEALDYDSQAIIRRELLPNGKGRIFINDTPSNLSTLKSLSEKLVTLLAQHQTLNLFNEQYQLFIVDVLANHALLLFSYKEEYKLYQKCLHKLKNLSEQSKQMKKDLDYILFQLNELEEANIEDPNEQTNIEYELKQLEHSESIKRGLLESAFLLDEGEINVLQMLKNVLNNISSILKYGKQYENLYERINSVIIEIKDLYAEIVNLEGNSNLNPERINEISERLSIFYKLEKKHGVQSLQELLNLQNELQQKSELVGNVDEQIKNLQIDIKNLFNSVLQKAKQISLNRENQFLIIENNINSVLGEVGMVNAKIQISHTILNDKELTIDGLDIVRFLFSANKGSQPSELKKVASGGELSRLMLSIQSLIAQNTALPTLIFDEIDTGISGETATKVGKVLQQLSEKHQVLSITHLPQIAAKGNSHLFVYKDNSSDRTISKVKSLNKNERIVEIAKMLSGDPPSQHAKENAKELLQY